MTVPAAAAAPVLRLNLDEIVDGKVPGFLANGRRDEAASVPPGAAAPTLIPDDLFGACLSFDGANTCLEVADLFPNPAAFTLSMWARPAAVGDTPFRALVGRQDGALNTRKPGLWMTRDGGIHYDSYDAANSRRYSGVLPGFFARSNEWAHIAWVKDGRSYRFYRNGVPFVNWKPAGTAPEQVYRSAGTPYNIGRVDNAWNGQIACLSVYARALSDDEVKRQYQDDRSARAAFRQSYPVAFGLRDENDRSVLYIGDAPGGYDLRLDITNASAGSITAPAGPATLPDESNYHFALQFRPGALIAGAQNQIALSHADAAEWALKGKRAGDGSVRLYLLRKAALTLAPAETRTLTLRHVRADAGGGSHNTRVELLYARLGYSGEVTPLSGSRVRYASIVSHLGQRQIPLHVGFVGSDVVLNDGSPQSLLLHLRNISADKTLTLNPASELVLSFDVSPRGKAPADWALATAGAAANITVAVVNAAGADWKIEKAMQGQSPEWVLRPDKPIALGPDQELRFRIGNIITTLPSGPTNLYLRYENIPGYWDGEFVCDIQKAPLLYLNQNVGIGTSNPQARLQVAGGAIMPAAGNADTAGILFPRDPGGGSGDAAWIRYYPRRGESTTFEIGTSNDPDDHIALMPSGSVGIGTHTPSAKLTVSAAESHLQLRREAQPSLAPILFLELFQDDTSPSRANPVYLNLRFHHAHRFWHRIEARPEGLMFKTGDLNRDDFITIQAGALRIGGITIGEKELRILHRLAAGELEFDLYNIQYGEYIYAASDPFARDSDRRSVFTWRRKETFAEARWRITAPK